LIFHIGFSKVGKVVDFRGEIAPDFARIFAYFAPILSGSKIYNPI
jgi:hypothetical protein